jgi:hypothetical protein
VTVQALSTESTTAPKNLYIKRVENNSSAMFAVLPTSTNFCKDDAEWYTDLEKAYDVAYDWSVDLHGERVNVYEVRGGKFIKMSEVFA